MKRIRILVAVSALSIALFSSSVIASADQDNGVDDAFLCPVVGHGVLNADENNGGNGVEAITPPVGTSLLPGKNQAGKHANANALNPEGPGNPDAGPGGNPDFSPIWPG